jgi:thioredoxin-like negative regulator of GroEL
MEILIRLGAAAIIIFAGIVLYMLVTRARLYLLRQRSSNGKQPAGLEEFREGTPAILYFTTPDCIPCRTTQGPAIEALREQFRDRVQIIKIDAAERADLANYWGVLSVPTTFIIDSAGQPRHVNNGVTLAPKLRQQLREFAGLSETTDAGSRSTLPVKQEAWHTNKS